MKWVEKIIVGLGFIITSPLILAQAPGQNEWVMVEETIITQETRVNQSSTRGQGFGMGGVPVEQVHTSKGETTSTQTSTTRSQPMNTAQLEQAVSHQKAISVKVLGVDRVMSSPSRRQESNQLLKVDQTFILSTEHPHVKITLSQSSINPHANGVQHLNLRLLLNNTSDKKLTLASGSFNKASTRSSDTPQTREIAANGSQAVQLTYELPQINGTYEIKP